MEPVTDGWTVGELVFYKDTGCSQQLTWRPDDDESDESYVAWEPIASGHRDEAAPERAFDALTWTEWHAGCYMCEANEAWVGVSFDEPVSVVCVELWQWGNRDYKTSRIALDRWEAFSYGGGGEWRTVLEGGNLVGHRWDTIRFVRCDTLDPPDHGRVVVSNGGFWPSRASFSCSGIRLMMGSASQDCLTDGTWTGAEPRCVAAIEVVFLLAVFVTAELVAFFAYYWFILRKKPPALHATSFVPEENLGKWSTHEVWGVREQEDKATFYAVLACPCCRLAETWHQVGQLPYYLGVWLPQCIFCLPCIGAFFRTAIRQRFEIKGHMYMDVLLWLCCAPCVATQEAKHIDTITIVADEEEAVKQRVERQRKERQEIEERKKKEQAAVAAAIVGVAEVSAPKLAPTKMKRAVTVMEVGDQF